MTTFQGSLLGLAPSVDLGSFQTGLERIPLAEGAWVDLRRSWVQGTDILFERLAQSVPWRAERRKMYDRTLDVPRLLAFYDDGDQLPDDVLVDMRNALRDHYRYEPGGDIRTAGLCLYRDGQDSVAWHGDRLGHLNRAAAIVAIVSLGESRVLLLRPRAGGPAHRFVLDSGDVFVMGGSCQRTWEHCVPKSKRSIGPRLSVQFRTIGIR